MISSATLDLAFGAALENSADGPVLIGYSGGGDSHALMLTAARWAKRHDRSIHAVIIDHALRQESAEEADLAAAKARCAGVQPHIVRWEGEKPKTGIQEAARDFRLNTFASSARALGAPTICLGHTLDDQAETVWIRTVSGGQARSLAGIAPKSPFPLWPKGRGLTLVRPFLGLRRDDLRAYLKSQGESWVDDPSNENRSFSRIRHRQLLDRLERQGLSKQRLATLANTARALQEAAAMAAAHHFFECVDLLSWGGVRIKPGLRKLGSDVAIDCLEAARSAVSGQPRPDRPSSQKLFAAYQEGAALTAGGVALVYHKGTGFLVRDPGALTGRANEPRPTWVENEGEHAVFDQRLLFEGSAKALLLGAHYPEDLDRSALADIPALARPGLPVIQSGTGQRVIPGVESCDVMSTRWLFSELICRSLFQDQPPSWFDKQLREQTAQASQ